MTRWTRVCAKRLDLTSRQDYSYEPDRRFPKWVRRSNPIVRRHLGGFWKVTYVEIQTLWRLFLLQVVLVLLSVFSPEILDLSAILGLLSLLLLPVGLVIYGRTLFLVSEAAIAAITDERRHNALDVLRVTPFSLRFILLSKIAASIWRQMGKLDMLVVASSLMSLSPIILEHVTLWPPKQSPFIPQLMIIVGLAATILRLFFEPVMFATLGILAGSSWMSSAPPIAWIALLGLSYFTLINLLRLLPLSWLMRLIVESVLPLVLPILITWSALRLAVYSLSRD